MQSVTVTYSSGGSTVETCETPTFSPDEGTYTEAQSVAISTTTSGASIYYTIDGSTPSASNGTLYTDAIDVSETTTIKAIAVKAGNNDSEVAEATYTIISGGGSDSKIYRKVTSTADLVAGKKYIIVYENGNESAAMGAFAGNSSKDVFNAVTNLSVNDHRVNIANTNGVLELTLGGSTGAWTLYTGDGFIHGNDGVNFSIVSTVGNASKWVISAEGIVQNMSYTTRYIRYYVSNPSFRHYTTSNGVAAYLYVQANEPTLTAESNPLNINDTNDASGRTGTIYVSGENLGNDNVGVTNYDPNHSTNFSSNPGYFSHNGTVTNYPVAITYNGRALSATGIVYPANNLASTSVNINYLYMGPIYVVGDVNNTYWNANNAPQMTRDENGLYTVNVTVQQSDGTAGYITFSKQSGSDYNNHRFGPYSSGNWWLDGNEGVYQPIDTVNYTVNNIRLLPGSYTMYVDSKTNKFMIEPYALNITISPEDGTHFTGETISGTITSNHADATLEWSTDGTNWQTYTDGFTASVASPGQSVTVYARATGNGVTSTAQATYTRDYAPAPDAPSFSIGSSAVGAGTVVTITAPEGCTLYVDGQQVNSPYDVTINHSTTISAYCVNDEGTQSTTVTNTYTIAAVCNAEIVFKDNGSDASSATSWAHIGGENDDNYFVAGRDYISSASDMEKIYKGATGLKFGTSSQGGTITFNLNDNTEWKVSHITLNAKAYNDNYYSVVTVTTSDDQTRSTTMTSSTLNGYTLDFDDSSSISSFTISTDARIHLKGFTITYDCAPTVEAPVITPDTGTYYENQTVHMSAGDGCTIYYTTNGTTPTTSSPVYTGEFPVAYTAGATTTIKAMAVDQDDNESEVTTVVYTWGTPEVHIHPDSRNTLATSINVTLTSEPTGGTIYYTTDGSTPSAENGTAYNGAFTVSIPNVGDQATVKAIAVLGSATSPVATATYTHVAEVLDVHDPFFSPLQNRTYYGDQTLQIGCTTPNADIYYEIVEVTGNTAPSASAVEDPTHMSNHYDGTPIEMTAGHSYYVKAIAYIGNYVSNITEGYYIIEEFTQTSNYFKSLKDFNDNATSGIEAHLVNPVQVVYHSTFTNDGDMAEFCYVRDNTDYALIYFGKADKTHKTIFEMGDWLDGSQIVGKTSSSPYGYHIQLGTSNHEITSWPNATIGHNEILPEETTCQVVHDGTQEGENSWGHYIHLRYTTLNNVADDSANDMKHNGYIADHSGTELNYYDKFYRWSAGTSTYQNTTYTIHEIRDYDQAFFDSKQNAGATFDVYGVVDYFSSKGFQLCPIDFLWIYKPVISLQSGTYTSEQTVSISVTTPEWAAEGEVIYYKTDDMEDWAVYTGPITVNSNTHLQVYAELPAHENGTYGGANYNDFIRSEIVEATYNFEGVEDPIITPASQVIEVVDGTESVNVTVETNPNSSTGTVTLYTTDGSDPRTSLTAIVLTDGNGTFTVTETTTVNAVSYLTNGGNTIWSNVVTETYEFIEDNGKTYNLLTTNPKVGSIYVIVNKADKVGLSKTQNATNRAATGVVFTDATKTVVKGNNALEEFVLEAATAGRYYFRQVGTQNYLCVTTNANPNLMTGAADANAEAAVTVNSGVASGVDESYPATVAFSYEGMTRYLRYYSNNRTFTTYGDATTNQDVFLYGIEAPELLPPVIDPMSQTVPDGTIINGTVTPDEQNPEGALTWYTTDGSDPRTSSTRILWTEDNNGAFGNIIDDATVKAVTGYEFGDGYVYSDVVSETYTFVFATSLAWIESEGVVETEYIVANELIGTWAVSKPDGTKLLWAKDKGNQSIDKRPAKTDGQKDYVKDILEYEWQETWDESNWVILNFANIDADPEEYVGHRITEGTVEGIYVNDRNFQINLTKKPELVNGNPLEKDMPLYTGWVEPFPEEQLGNNYSLAYNSYVPANFMTENHNHYANGESGPVIGFVAGDGALGNLEGDSLYFVNPKIQEVAHIWAVWNEDDIFTVYKAEHKENENINAWNLDGTFRVNWTYNCMSKDTGINGYGEPTSLVKGVAYEFHAAIMHPATSGRTVDPQGTPNPGTPSNDYELYPLDVSDDGTPTAVVEIGTNKVAVGVMYYNLMGQPSSTPFDGVNIIVTRYSDGSTSTTKVLR